MSLGTIILKLRYWIPIAVAVTLLSGLVYLTVQQVFRQGANDPQIQMVEDAVAKLENETEPQFLVSQGKVDIGKSLAPFLIIYDEDRKVVASSGILEDEVPAPPAGVFDFAREHGGERLTWQPRKTVRIATVIIKYDKGFVLAGRSLREVESRVERLEMHVGLAWLTTLFASLVATFIFVPRGNKKSP